MKSDNQIKFLYTWDFLQNFYIAQAIFTLFLLSNGLNMGDVLFLQAIFFLSLAVWSLAGGIIADIIGRRTSLIISSFLLGLAVLFYAFGKNIYQFAIAEVFWSFQAMGKPEAWLYDYLKTVKESKFFHKIMGNRNIVISIARLLSSAVSGFVASVSYRFAVQVGAIPLIASIVPAFLLKEPKFKRSGKTAINHFIYSVRLAKKEKWFAFFVVYTSLLFSLTMVAWWFFQPALKGGGLPVEWIGIVFMVGYLMTIMGSKVSSFFRPVTGIYLYNISSVIAVGFLYFSFVLSNWVFALLSLIIFNFFYGIGRPCLFTYLHRRIRSATRGMFSSFFDVGFSLSSALLLILFSPIASVSSEIAVFVLCAILVFLALIPKKL